jgi:hypothetical protein
VRLGAVVAIGIAAGLGVWLGTRGGGSHTATPARAAGPTGEQVVPVTAGGLETLVSALGRPIYWAGPMPGERLELTRLANGEVFVRYLPVGVKVGSTQAELTVGTYQVNDALGAVERSASSPQAVRLAIKGGAVAFYNRGRPTNVYLAFPGGSYQIEVFDPNPARAKSLVEGGHVVPVAVRSRATSARLVSVTELRKLPKSLGHPVYWAGPRPGTTYEVSQPSGRVYVRYLPAGTNAGANVATLTVATYRVPNAYAVTRGLAARPDSVQVPVTGGAIAFYAKSAPSSVYLALPGSDVQVEVYDPSPADARTLVTAGKIVPVR